MILIVHFNRLIRKIQDGPLDLREGKENQDGFR